MNNSVKLPKLVVKIAISFMGLVFVSWVGWVSTGILEAGKEGVKIETIQKDVEYIRKRIDDFLMNYNRPAAEIAGPPPPIKVHPTATEQEGSGKR